MGPTVTLQALARQLGGWPIRPDRIAQVLAAADAVLPQGRDTTGPLTDEQIRLLIVYLDE